MTNEPYAYAVTQNGEPRIVTLLEEHAEAWVGDDAYINDGYEIIPFYQHPQPALTDAERDAIRRLGPSDDPLASYVVTLSPAERRMFYGLLKRPGGEQ